MQYLKSVDTAVVISYYAESEYAVIFFRFIVCRQQCVPHTLDMENITIKIIFSQWYSRPCHACPIFAGFFLETEQIGFPTFGYLPVV